MATNGYPERDIGNSGYGFHGYYEDEDDCPQRFSVNGSDDYDEGNRNNYAGYSKSKENSHRLVNCKYCNEPGLHWDNSSGKYRLYNGNVVHSCSQYRNRDRTVELEKHIGSAKINGVSVSPRMAIESLKSHFLSVLDKHHPGGCEYDYDDYIYF